MSQVKQHQQGGVANVSQPTPSPSQLAFKVNGNEFKLDEQAIRDKFNPIFDNLVKSGEAHERDRDKWLASNEQILKNAKGGTYDLSSSNGQLYNEHYNGNATGESLGLNADGEAARKTKLGNFFARGSKNDAQRVAMLNHYLGTSIVGDYTQNQADLKKKALEQADKDKALGQDHAQNILSKAMMGYGEGAYGKDFSDSPDLIYSKWFGKDSNNGLRYSTLRNYQQSRYDNLFNPELDKYKDYFKGKGIDLDSIREKAGQYYDPTTKALKGKYSRIGDLLNLSNPFDTMGIDNTFIDRAAYDKSRQPAASGTLGTQPGTTAPNPLKQTSNGLWSDGTHFWQDKDKTHLMTGFGKDNLLYGDDGKLFRGWYLHQNDPDNPNTGWYDAGKRGEVVQGKNYMDALAKSPANTSRLKELEGQYSQIVSAYDRTLGDNHWLDASQAPKDNATYNVWASEQAAGRPFAKTADVTGKFSGLNGKANVQAYQTQQLNAYGRNRIYHMVTLPSHKKFYGTIQTDLLNNVTGMVDPHGNKITDPELQKALTGSVYNSKNHSDYGNTTFTGSATPSLSPTDAAAKRAVDAGGVPVMQAGGSISSSTLFDNSQDQPAATPKVHDINVGDIGKAISDPGYHISGSDKAELAALGLNLSSLATSIFGGGGAGLATGLGAAGTVTQYGADLSKHGFKLGDLASAGLGLGLDAAAAIPGLGVLSEGSKLAKNITKVSRYLVPALTAYGFGQAAKVVMDVAAGNKHLKDLNIDDMRALTNGIGAVVGGARNITQRLGTTTTSNDFITLKNGEQVKLSAPDVLSINNAEDKVAAAKQVVSTLKGIPLDQVELAQKTTFKPSWANKSLTTKVDNANIVTKAGSRVPVNPEDVQGDGWLSSYKRWAAEKANIRDLGTAGQYKGTIDPKYKLNADGNIDQTTAGAPGQKTFSFTGDYWKNGATKKAAATEGESLGDVVGQRRENSGNYTASPAQPTYEYEAGKTATVGDVPDTRRIYGSMFGMRSLDNERSVSYEQIRNRLKGLTGTKSSRDQLNKFMTQKFDDGSFAKGIQDQIAQALNNPGTKGYLKFQQGGTLPYPYRLPKYDSNPLDLTTGYGAFPNQTNNAPFTPYPYRKTEYSDPTQAGLNLWNPLTTLGFKGATAPVANGAVASPSTLTGTVAGSTGSGLNLPKFNINTNTLSELGRALYTSQLNKQIDTRVERPMLSAPTEVSTPVRGNFYAQNVANNQANNLVRDSQSFKTSDGSLQMLGNLEAQRNAAQIRMQGAQQNSAAIQQSQQMNIQNQMQNAQARNNVANENIQTNARATQAERQAENEKHAQVNAPLLEFWKNEDNKGYYQQQQNKSIDTQIGGLGEEAKVRNQQQQLSQAMYKVWNDQSIPDNERQARYQQLSNQQNDLQNRLTNRLLQLRKNPYQHFTDDANYYNIGPIAGYKDGGAMKLQVQETKDSNEASRDAAKAINTANKDSMQDDTKKHLEAMKEISDMIKLALK